MIRSLTAYYYTVWPRYSASRAPPPPPYAHHLYKHIRQELITGTSWIAGKSWIAGRGWGAGSWARADIAGKNWIAGKSLRIGRS